MQRKSYKVTSLLEIQEMLRSAKIHDS